MHPGQISLYFYFTIKNINFAKQMLHSVRQNFYQSQNFVFPKLIQRETWKLHWKMRKIFKFPLVHISSRVCQPSESLSPPAFSRQMDWESGSDCRASQLTTFDPFTFIYVGVHKGIGVPNEAAKCGRTGSPNNCCAWVSYTRDAAGHLARGALYFGHLSGH
jgi:hypothetical protein